MNTSIIANEAVKVASNVAAPIVTPIASLISGTTATPTSTVAEASVATAEASTVAATEASAAAATSAVAGEKLILGISQRNLFIGAGVLGVAAVAGTGAFMVKKAMNTPKAGVIIVLKDPSNLPSAIIGDADGKKLTHKEKKEAKELVKAIGGLKGEVITQDLVKIASSETPELMGIRLDKYPDTNIQFNSVEDRAGFGAALVHQAICRSAGCSTIMEYDSTGARPVIRVIPVVKGQRLTTFNTINVADNGDQK